MGEIKFRLGFEDYGNKKTIKKRQAIAAKNLTKKQVSFKQWFKKAKDQIRRFLEEASR